MADRNLYLQPQVGAVGDAGNYKRFGTPAAGAAILTTDLALNRTTGLCKVPAGFVLLAYSFTITDVDTNGSPTVQLQLGDSGSAARIMAANTVGQAGGTVTTLAAAGVRYKFTVETEIFMTASTAAATAAAGTVNLDLLGYVE